MPSLEDLGFEIVKDTKGLPFNKRGRPRILTDEQRRARYAQKLLKRRLKRAAEKSIRMGAGDVAARILNELLPYLLENVPVESYKEFTTRSLTEPGEGSEEMQIWLMVQEMVTRYRAEEQVFEGDLWSKDYYKNKSARFREISWTFDEYTKKLGVVEFGARLMRATKSEFEAKFKIICYGSEKTDAAEINASFDWWYSIINDNAHSYTRYSDYDERMQIILQGATDEL